MCSNRIKFIWSSLAPANVALRKSQSVTERVLGLEKKRSMDLFIGAWYMYLWDQCVGEWYTNILITGFYVMDILSWPMSGRHIFTINQFMRMFHFCWARAMHGLCMFAVSLSHRTYRVCASKAIRERWAAAKIHLIAHKGGHFAKWCVRMCNVPWLIIDIRLYGWWFRQCCQGCRASATSCIFNAFPEYKWMVLPPRL